MAALTNVIESFETKISPQLARAVAATVLVKREIAKEYGLLTEADVRRSLALTAESEFPDLFSIPYRKQIHFPGFQLEAVVGGAGAQRIRPFISRLKKLALERSWTDEDVVFPSSVQRPTWAMNFPSPRIWSRAMTRKPCSGLSRRRWRSSGNHFETEPGPP
ncbi:hypothetical protein [Arthrobacter sp. 135MFCol5.1]|uniref:hypothetical protein n=1 Tax=Arthrobacter sp. 135MFCol5.1 TaxID=1158050 RepID=UPI0012DE2AA6|nr:hypothetical protein [Arthrobacter sp. 135MFCol5.1]